MSVRPLLKWINYSSLALANLKRYTKCMVSLYSMVLSLGSCLVILALICNPILVELRYSLPDK